MEQELHALRMRMYQAEALGARSDAVLEAARSVLERPGSEAALEELRLAIAGFDAAMARMGRTR
jgi:hypothetical protein